MLGVLRNSTFARLYTAQTISLLGDALTWVGLALLAVNLAGDRSPTILATALTCRIIAFIICAPIAGIIADRFDRKLILIGTHLIRMLLVGLLPFVQTIWELYAIVLLLNIFHACFTPTYQATIPIVTKPQEYADSMALASITYQTLTIVGPALAGMMAGWLGARTIFWLDSSSFLLSALVISSIKQPLNIPNTDREIAIKPSYSSQLMLGTKLLFGDKFIKYALFIQLVGAIIGGQILVNTVSYIHQELHLGDREYGWVMMAFGVGTVIAALILAKTQTYLARHWTIFVGAILMILAMLFANRPSLISLILLWTIAGIGQNSINLITQIAIGDRIPIQQHGKVYAAHFAWSHLWWGLAYPLAGWLGTNFPQWMFPLAGACGLLVLVIVQLCLSPGATEHEHPSLSHTHQHSHDLWHQHVSTDDMLGSSHAHSHYHSATKHAHFHWHNNHHHHQ
jgi:MFS transporter, NRE family, putaive nickel resistance protein